ncbi:hypothetical protein FRX31_031789 [Thalictrum thalictroides]|uniref:Reverse transcriptase n=1 Tax=Thalictrum thalictroides TaxID=46969 RepID=A0A7J6V0Z3_THATH|nr:hypothetical protein FRX31_031789 [Thalictrum thalictroides]
MPPLNSDHSPILLSWVTAHKGLFPFRFNNAWTLKPLFFSLVNSEWQSQEQGNHVYVLHQKLKRLKGVLRTWAKLHFSNLNERVEAAKKKLQEVQKLLETNAQDVLLINEDKNNRKEYTDLLKMEYEGLKQKTNCTWMLKGDRCTAFFHGILKERKSSNKIWAIYDSQGSKLTDAAEVQGMVVKHYIELLGSMTTKEVNLETIE